MPSCTLLRTTEPSGETPIPLELRRPFPNDSIAPAESMRATPKSPEEMAQYNRPA